jgi:hypothetical protein
MIHDPAVFFPGRNGTEDHEKMYQHYMQQKEQYCYILCYVTEHGM